MTFKVLPETENFKPSAALIAPILSFKNATIK